MDFYSNVGTTDIVGKFFNPIVTTLSFDELWENYYATNEPINISNSVLFSVPKDIEGNDLRYEGSIWITDINGYLYPMTPTFNRIIELEKKLNYFTNDTFTKITSISWIDKNPSGSSVITSTNPLKTSTKQIEIKYENNTFEYVSINKVSLFTFAVYVKTDDDIYVNTSTYWYSNPGEYYIKAIIPAYKSESGKDLYTDSYLKWTIKNVNDNTPSNPNDNTPSNPDDNTPSNPDDTSTIYYWYVGTTLPNTSNINTIGTSVTSKPNWPTSNPQSISVTVTNITGESLFIYYCFPTQWNVTIYDEDKESEMTLATDSTFTYNNIEYIVLRQGRKTPNGGTKDFWVSC